MARWGPRVATCYQVQKNITVHTAEMSNYNQKVAMTDKTNPIYATFKTTPRLNSHEYCKLT